MTHSRLIITEVSSSYWRVTISNPPINLFDPEMQAETRLLLDRIDADDEVKVVVFDSANPDYFIAHIDLLRREEAPDVPGYAPYAEWPTLVSRLAASRVLSVASVRGRARGHGNEFALACDLRFASQEKAIFGQLEVALGVVPGGGGIEWLSALTGRSRALEIVLGSDDFDAVTAERYGWVNRALPDADLDAFVDRLARRIAGFDRDVLRLAKAGVNSRAGVPSESDRWGSNYAFTSAATKDAAKAAVTQAFAVGLQQPGEYELNLGDHLGRQSQPVG